MKQKKDNKLIIFGLIIVVLLALIAFGTREKKEVVNYNELTEEEINFVIENRIETMKKEDLSKLTERERIEAYVISFANAVEAGEYEKAYNMLHEEFKTKFFPTLDSFETYAKEKLPIVFAMNHTNFERIGDTYVLWVEMRDALSSKDPVEMKFIVKENAMNDFVLSFSVI